MYVYIYIYIHIEYSSRSAKYIHTHTYTHAYMQTFRTDKGRLVRDGGGIEPDIFVAAPRASELELGLLEQNAFLAFAGEWYVMYMC